jgi:hypothetical protein
MRLKLGLVVVSAALLLLSGLHPGTLPYMQGETRYSDAVTAHWPNALFLRESLLRGEFPLWRETTMGGQPFAANPLNKTAYPPQWLVILLPSALHLDLLIVLHLLIAAAGMWRWLRVVGLHDEAAAFGALAYALAPRVLGHLAAGHLDVLYALAWWPWLMVGVVRCVGTGYIPSLQRRGTVLTALQFGMVAALCALADVRVALFAFISAGVYGAYLLLVHQQDENSRQIQQSRVSTSARRLFPVGFLGFALALPVAGVLTVALLVPLVLWQSYLSRASLSTAEAGVFPLEVTHFLGLILPAHRGGPETLTYLGLVTLTLAGIGLAALLRRQRALLAAALLLAALYAMGANGFLWPTLTQLVPGLLWFRVPSRAWLVVALLVPALAGYGVNVLLEAIHRKTEDEAQSSTEVKAESAPDSRLRLIVVAWMGLTALVGVFALLVLPLPDSIGASALVIGLLTGGVLLAALTGRLRANIVALLLLVVLVADLGWTGVNVLTWRGEESWLNPHRPLAERLVELGADRIFSPTYSLEQQVAQAYGLRLFGGVDPFQLNGIVRAVEAGSGVASAGYNPVLPPLTGISGEQEVALADRDAQIDTAVLARWSVSHVVAAYRIEHPRLELVEVVSGVAIHRNLDYQPRGRVTTVPDWPTDWPGLPDAAAVTRLNQITSIAYLVSGIGWVVCLGLLFLFRKQALQE